jgi:hypothetical protein
LESIATELVKLQKMRVPTVVQANGLRRQATVKNLLVYYVYVVVIWTPQAMMPSMTVFRVQQVDTVTSKVMLMRQIASLALSEHMLFQSAATL